MKSDVIRDFERVPTHLVKQCTEFQPAIFADVNGRRGAMHGRIAALRPHMKIVGPALTVEVRPGDNLMIHAAMALAKPGDVLVIDGKGDLTAALMGALMMNACRRLLIAGVIIDGAVRDTIEIEEMDYPVFAAGANPNGPTKCVAGRIGYPVSCGGVTVHAGDLIVADADGVVVLASGDIEELLPLAANKVADESKRLEQIKAGNTKAGWLLGALRTAGALKDGETL